MKVIFVGKDGSGKSSAIRYLTDNGENVQSTGTTTTNEVLASTELWFPFQTNDSDFNNTFSEEEQILCFELWNYSSNSKISRKCQDLAMSNTCVYIIISNMAEEDSLSGIIDSLNVVQTKAPGVPVTIVGTHSDDMVLDKRQEWLSSLQQVLQKCKVKQEEKIKEELEHLQQLNDTNTSIKLSSCRQNMSDLLKAISNIQTNMVCTSITTGKGFDELRRVITTTALSNGRWLNFKNKMNESTMSKLYNELHSLTTFGVILLTLDKFKNLAHTCDIHSCKDVSTTLEILREMGVVSYLAKYVDFPGNTPSCLPSIICINQASFQEVLHSIHLEDCTKAFKFESKRFWPKSSNDKRPDPLILVRAIEEIPTQGVIRECLFPLILQVS
ncbi:uncharacterized protein [Antedon mediterranea]|uniref:uncharacterized protein n=1 Tax=Antedon mediterranea TaxID=105859 RepID=UPI003AF5DEAF